MKTSKRRILFFGEAVTLAHIVRPVVLAQALDPARYDVQVACHPRYNHLFGPLPFELRSIESISPQLFLDRLQRREPLLDVQTLRGYVREDLQVMRGFAPDLIIGDFRLSLSVSARLAGIPYAAVTSAYWSPYARRQFPIPEHPIIGMFGVRTAQALFNLIRPFAFVYHSLPLNRVRHEYGLPLLRFDYVTPLTDGDYVLYADVPELLPTINLPHTHHYLGPVLWSPSVKIPDWWDHLPRDKPVVYVNLGSSGEARLLPVILQALCTLPVTVLAATAGRAQLPVLPSSVYVADYLPGEEAAKLADVVICNGGSPATHQALAAGKPVLGIASNMDQFLNMQAICLSGAGELLRASRVDAESIISLVPKILHHPTYAEAAKNIASIFSKYHAPGRFREILDNV